MPVGPGKYDDEATFLRNRTHAAGVAVIVVEGDSGTGFSVQAPVELHFLLPDILRHVADEIETDLKRMAKGN